MFSAPQQLLKAYYKHYQGEMGGIDYDTFVETVLKEKPEAIEEMAEYMRTDRYSSLDQEDYEERIGIAGWREEQPSWLETVGSKIAERTTDLGAGLMTTIDETAEWLEEKVPLGAIEYQGGLGFDYVSPEEIKERGFKNTMKDAAKGMRDIDFEYAYEDQTSWEDFKESPITSFIPFAMEHGLASTPDMVAAVAALPVYVMARTGEIGQERAENDLREEATIDDLLKAMPAAVASATLERIGAAKMFGLTDKLKDATLKEIGKAAGRRAATESGTEAVQEPIEQVGGGAGTKRWAKLTGGQIAAQLAEASAQGAVVGLGFGGVVGSATTVGQAATGKTEQAQAALAEMNRQAEANAEAQNEASQAKVKARQAAALKNPPQPTAAAPDAGVAPAPEVAPEVAPEPAVDRPVESMILDEEVGLGKRARLAPEEAAVGQKVTVDDGTGTPATGTVTDASPRLVRVTDEAGAPIAVIRPDRPLETDPAIYTDLAPQVDPKIERLTTEMGRLIKRTLNNPNDENSLDALRKMRGSQEFTELSPEARDMVDDHLQDVMARFKEAQSETREKEKAAPAPEPRPPPVEPETYPPADVGIVSPRSRLLEAVENLKLPEIARSRIAAGMAKVSDSLPTNATPSQIAAATVESIGPAEGSEVMAAVARAADKLPVDATSSQIAAATARDLEAPSGAVSDVATGGVTLPDVAPSAVAGGDVTLPSVAASQVAGGEVELPAATTSQVAQGGVELPSAVTSDVAQAGVPLPDVAPSSIAAAETALPDVAGSQVSQAGVELPAAATSDVAAGGVALPETAGSQVAQAGVELPAAVASQVAGGEVALPDTAASRMMAAVVEDLGAAEGSEMAAALAGAAADLSPNAAPSEIAQAVVRGMAVPEGSAIADAVARAAGALPQDAAPSQIAAALKAIITSPSKSRIAEAVSKAADALPTDARSSAVAQATVKEIGVPVDSQVARALEGAGAALPGNANGSDVAAALEKVVLSENFSEFSTWFPAKVEAPIGATTDTAAATLPDVGASQVAEAVAGAAESLPDAASSDVATAALNGLGVEKGSEIAAAVTGAVESLPDVATVSRVARAITAGLKLDGARMRETQMDGGQATPIAPRSVIGMSSQEIKNAASEERRAFEERLSLWLPGDRAKYVSRNLQKENASGERAARYLEEANLTEEQEFHVLGKAGEGGLTEDDLDTLGETASRGEAYAQDIKDGSPGYVLDELGTALRRTTPEKMQEVAGGGGVAADQENAIQANFALQALRDSGMRDREIVNKTADVMRGQGMHPEDIDLVLEPFFRQTKGTPPARPAIGGPAKNVTERAALPHEPQIITKSAAFREGIRPEPSAPPIDEQQVSADITDIVNRIAPGVRVEAMEAEGGVTGEFRVQGRRANHPCRPRRQPREGRAPRGHPLAQEPRTLHRSGVVGPRQRNGGEEVGREAQDRGALSGPLRERQPKRIGDRGSHRRGVHGVGPGPARFHEVARHPAHVRADASLLRRDGGEAAEPRSDPEGRQHLRCRRAWRCWIEGGGRKGSGGTSGADARASRGSRQAPRRVPKPRD